MKDFVIRLQRVVFEKEYTEGWWILPKEGSELNLGDSLEDRVRDFNKDGDLGEAGEEKVYGKTAIPFGRHKVIATWSNKFQQIRPEVIIASLTHTGIRIHWGRRPKNTLGCPLAGQRDGAGTLTNNGLADRINEMFMKELNKGRKCYLDVI